MAEETKSIFDLQEELHEKIVNGVASLSERVIYSNVVALYVQAVKDALTLDVKRSEPTQTELKTLLGQEFAFDCLVPNKKGDLVPTHIVFNVGSEYAQDKQWYINLGLTYDIKDDDGNVIGTERVKDNASYGAYLEANGMEYPAWLEKKTTVFISDYEVAAKNNGPVKDVYTCCTIKEKIK